MPFPIATFNLDSKKFGIYILDPFAMDKEVGPSIVFQEITNNKLEVEGNFIEGGLEGNSSNVEDDRRAAKDHSLLAKAYDEEVAGSKEISNSKILYW